MNKLLSVAAGLAALVCLTACESGLPVEAHEKTLVLRAGDLVPFGYGLEETGRADAPSDSSSSRGPALPGS